MFNKDVKTGRLGFGTSALAGRIGRKESLRLLETAYDAGIRYFDTAPMYGYGAAEELLGEFLRTRRDHVTIATKFGIEPPKRSTAMKVIKTVAQGVVSLAPSLRSTLSQRAAQMVSHGNFTLPYAAMSLKRSLAALKTPHIDIFLMHEVALEQMTPELLDFLEAAVQRGEINQYGAATGAEETLRILRSGIAPGTVAQFPDKIAVEATDLLPASHLCVTHSVLGEDFRTFCAAIAEDEQFARSCSNQLGFACKDTRKLGRFFLWTAMERNKHGIVVFGSLQDASIRANAAMQQQSEFSAGQLDAFEVARSGRRSDARTEVHS